MTRQLRFLAVAGATLALLVGAGTAAADDGAAPTKHPFLEAVAAKLGVTPQQLQAAMRTAMQERLDARLKAMLDRGLISQQRYDELKAKLATGDLKGLFGKANGRFEERKAYRLAHRGLGGAAADCLGMSRSELRQAWKSGQSLSQVAASKNVDLKSCLTKKLDARIAKAGDRISAEQAAKLRERFAAWLDKALVWAPKAKTS